MRTYKLQTALLILIPFLIQCSGEPENSNWRGPNRDGIFCGCGLLAEWPDEGPNLLWQQDVGLGYSSAAVLSDKIFTLGAIDSTGYINALDLEGNIVWKKEYGKEWTRSFPGSRSTPVISDGLGYFVSSFGLMVCFRTETGEFIWEKEIFDRSVNKDNLFGITENLVIDEDKVFCTPGGKFANVIALDRFDGTLIWESEALGQKNAYCSPIIIERGARKFYINNSGGSVIALDVDDGELVWSFDLENKQNIHANTPIYKNGHLFIMDGFEAGSMLLEISESGTKVKQVWHNPSLDETNGHAVWIDDYIYVAAESDGKFCAVDWKTGEIEYSIDRYSPGTVIAAGGLLYCYSYDGDFGLLEPSDGEFVEKGSFILEKERRLHISHPVIKDGRLYIRYKNTLSAYDIAE